MQVRTIRSRASGRTISFHRLGRGEPLLYLHHILGIVRDEVMVGRLASDFDVVAPYIPGWGPAKDDLSAVQSAPLDLVLHVLDLLDELGLDSVLVAGQSIGGWLAAELAAIAPARVRRLVLVNPLGLWLDESPGEDPFAQHPMTPSVGLFSEPGLRHSILLPDASYTPEAEAEVIITEMMNLRAAARFLWPIPDTGVRRRLGRIKAPTLVVHGSADRIVPWAQARAWEQGIAGSRLTSLAGAGHLAGLEQPVATADAITGFLSGAAVG